MTGGGPGAVTLLFTDLVGSTELAQRLGEVDAESFRRQHFGLLRTALEAHGGREVKNLGDGLMVAFGDAAAAIAAAVAIQRAVGGHNRSGDGPPFAVRIGVQAGDPVRDGEDYFGTPVIVAKRLCDRATAGQILTTADVAGLVRPGEGPALRAVGALDLKGLADPVAAVEVTWDGVARTPEPATAPAVHVVRPPALAPPPDPFVGRDAEIAALTGLLRRARMVTIVGPGGVGKTRLSGHLVDAVAVDYPGGVWCCALASVGTDGQVPDAVATALRVERRSGVELLDRIVEFLAPKKALLVLDNCEQVVEGAAELCAAVLAGTSAVDVLVTTREALGVAGEHRVPLDPLAVDGAGSAGAPAVALFLERAAAAGRRLAEADLLSVRELCRRVDGLPLAIELAAARVTTRSVPEIVADVTHHLLQLGVRRGRDERHRSIHALVGWSYGLLDEADRRVFERMAVFAGGADTAAVAAVAGVPEALVVERLSSLTDQSLVTARGGGPDTRYALLEPVRAYAAQRLAERGDTDAARTAHARHFVELAERTHAQLIRTGALSCAGRLIAELNNLRAVQEWHVVRDDADGALRLAGAVFWPTIVGGAAALSEGAEQAAERHAGTGHPSLAMAWATAAASALLRGDQHRVGLLTGRAAAAAEAAGTPDALRCAAFMDAAAAIYAGDWDRAAALGELTAGQARAAGDALSAVLTTGAAAIANAYAGRPEPARLFGDASLAIARTSGDPALLAWSHYYAAEARLESAPEEALALQDVAVAQARSAGHHFVLGVAGLSAVSLRARTGDSAATLGAYAELIEYWQRAGWWQQQWLTLRNLVEALARAGRHEHAAVLHGAMRASRLAPPLNGPDAGRLARVLDALGEAMGSADLMLHQERGAMLGDIGAVSYALEVLREIPGAGT